MTATASQNAPANNVDTLDIAYMAIGAGAALERLDHDKRQALVDHCGGQLAIINEVIQHAETLSRIFDELEDGFPGVWAYEVAEPFGQRYVEALTLDFSPDPGQLVRTLVGEA